MTESPRSDAGRCSRPDSSRPSRQESSPAGPARGATVRRSARGAAAVRVSVTRRVGPRECPGPAAAPSTGPTGAVWRSTTGGASRERRRPHAARAALTTPGRAPEPAGAGVARERNPRAVERRPAGVRHRPSHSLESLCRPPRRRVLDESLPSAVASPSSSHTAHPQATPHNRHGAPTTRGWAVRLPRGPWLFSALRTVPVCYGRCSRRRPTPVSRAGERGSPLSSPVSGSSW